ncbi:unnamed protein product, partial [Laminaria digitata]
LARGEVDKAVALYESCVQETVGKELWSEFNAASVPTKKAIANLFYRSRDYQRAALACQELGEWGAAAKAYAASYDYKNAGMCLSKKGDQVGAAQMYEKGGEHRQAAEIYYREKRLGDAAGALEKAGDAFAAGQLFMQAKDDHRAAQMLSQVGPQHPRYVHAVGLLSEVLVRMGRRDLAVQRLGAALPAGGIKDKLVAELGYRLGRLMWEAGEGAQAQRAFQLVAAFDPGFKDVQDCLRRINGGQTQAPPAGTPFTAMGATQSMRAPNLQAGATIPAAPARQA